MRARLLSLDVFRGLTMAAMVIVNNPGDWGHVYPPLLHAEWHGWTPTDLVSDPPRGPQRPAPLLFVAGLVVAALGLLWDLWFPINKNLWTSSYVLFSGGVAAALLAAGYWLIDVAGVRRGTKPFEILGLNAITLFVLSGLIARLLGIIRVPRGEQEAVALKTFIYGAWFAPAATPRNASLLWAIANLVVLFGILALMYRRRIFLRA